ncbi:MAG: DTW domain-containing protein [Myxococcota bacterium]
MQPLPASDLPPGDLFLPHGRRCTGCGFPRAPVEGEDAPTGLVDPALMCLCADLPHVPSRTRVLVVRHASERRKASNTGGLAARVLGGTLVHHGLPGVPLDLRGHLGEAPRLLLPQGTTPLDTPPSTLVVLDGTWHQVRAMRARIPPLPEVPLLSLPVAPPRSRMRLHHLPEGRSTMEAIADALDFLGEPEPARALRELYAELAKRWLELRQSPFRPDR